MRKRKERVILSIIAAMIGIVFLFPIFFTWANSFMSQQEIIGNYSVLSEHREQGVFNEKYMQLKLIPEMVEIKQYYEILVSKTQYLIMFWNSVLLCIPIVTGQIVVASMAAYAFSKIKFVLRNELFFIYIVIMLMPFQVTLVPNFIISEKLGLLGNYSSIILPGIFNAFGVFLLRQIMLYIPDTYIEAAIIDGANHPNIYVYIIMPMVKSGIVALAILLLIDNWNMVEQPLIFLDNATQYPLSVFLIQVNKKDIDIAFAASSIYMIPMILIFLYGENYLVEGIRLSGIKG